MKADAFGYADLAADRDHWKARAETAEAEARKMGEALAAAFRISDEFREDVDVEIAEHLKERQRAEEAAGRWAMELETLRDLEQAARAWRAMRADTPTKPKPESAALVAAVDALPAEETPNPTDGGPTAVDALNRDN